MTTRVYKCDTPGCKASFEWPESHKPGQAKAAAVKAGWLINDPLYVDMCGPCRFGAVPTSTPAKPQP